MKRRSQAPLGSRGASACAIEVPDKSIDGLRIAAIFIIFAGSLLGAILPIWLARSSKMRVPKLAFFVCKYFGSGVIIATSFMHLLSEAEESLGKECLTGILPEYDWAMGIGLMTTMLMFWVELVMSRFEIGGGHSHTRSPERDSMDVLGGKRQRSKSPDIEGGCSPPPESDDSAAQLFSEGSLARKPPLTTPRTSPSESPDLLPQQHMHSQLPCPDATMQARIPGKPNEVTYPPGGEDHLGHHRSHVDGDSYDAYAAQMMALFILEFGVIFHGIFIGLTLAVKPADSFVVFFLVILFHQIFEGLGLGSRLATASWPADGRRWSPYLLGFAFALSTPLAMAVGVAVRSNLQQGSAKSLIVSGVFDAISGGILLYTGLVELLAHEFMFSPEMRAAGFDVQMFAYGCVALGAGLMALLAKWA